MPPTGAVPRRFRKLKEGTLEWEATSHSTDDLSAGMGSFQYSMGLSGGSVEPLLACPNTRCRNGGFEVGFLVESMISEEVEERVGVLVCIGWERAGDGRESRSPCTRAIRYRAKLSYARSVGSMIRQVENGTNDGS